jgi:two-component system, chemotaxis family, sensor kinase CheA
MMDTPKDAYREEANELLVELETSLLELEERPDDSELIGRVFRAMHTIKGSGAMFGFDAIAEFTHEVETVFDQVRENTIAVTTELVNLTLAARDQIKAMLDEDIGGEPADTAKSQEIINSLRQLQPQADAQAEPQEMSQLTENPSPSPEREKNTTYRILFRPHLDLFRCGTNPLPLLNELRELGLCDVVVHTDTIPVLAEIDPEGCYLYWDVILTTDKGINSIKDVFIFAEDDCELVIDVIAEAGFDDENDYKRLGEILIDRGNISSEDLERILIEQKRIGEVLVESKKVDTTQVEAALVEQQHVRKVQKRREKPVVSSIRVDSVKLDGLVDLVGELVTVQARLTRKGSSSHDPELLLIAEEVERLTEELRDNTMSIRMQPIGTLFTKFNRLVRDLSSELKKEIVMEIEGAETELDKTVIERLNDPLVHIIRNSIDHGIEVPEQRRSVGKESTGQLHLSAEHAGTNVLIKISDDGQGLDSEAIRAKAVEKGLLSADAEATEQELFALLFAAGFSTAKTVSDVSGRGVGMDVVRRSIESLGGSIELDSTLGQGTTITLKLPLTLAIIDGLLVKIGDGHFVVPLASVDECLELTRAEADRARVRNMMEFRGHIFPYLNLHDQFLINSDQPEIEQVVIVETDGDKVGFGVDQVIGQHQTVIKTLNKVYKNVKEISGATILGDGSVALIVDVHMIAKEARLHCKN